MNVFCIGVRQTDEREMVVTKLTLTWITINVSRILKLSADSVLVSCASNQEYSSSRESSLALKRIESVWH
jgi:hypothetical protein